MAKKWFRLIVVAYTTCLVEAEDAESAQESACGQLSFGDFELDTTEKVEEITDPDRLARLKKSSDVKVLADEEGGAK